MKSVRLLLEHGGPSGRKLSLSVVFSFTHLLFSLSLSQLPQFKITAIQLGRARRHLRGRHEDAPDPPALRRERSRRRRRERQRQRQRRRRRRLFCRLGLDLLETGRRHHHLVARRRPGHRRRAVVPGRRGLRAGLVPDPEAAAARGREQQQRERRRWRRCCCCCCGFRPRPRCGPAHGRGSSSRCCLQRRRR